MGWVRCEAWGPSQTPRVDCKGGSSKTGEGRELKFESESCRKCLGRESRQGGAELQYTDQEKNTERRERQRERKRERKRERERERENEKERERERMRKRERERETDMYVHILHRYSDAASKTVVVHVACRLVVSMGPACLGHEQGQGVFKALLQAKRSFQPPSSLKPTVHSHGFRSLGSPRIQLPP